MVSTDSLKPAYLERDEAVAFLAEMAPQQNATPTTPKKVSFPSLPEKISGGGVGVAIRAHAPRQVSPPTGSAPSRRKRLTPQPFF